MKYAGLTAKEAAESRSRNGSNVLTRLPPEPLWRKILSGLRDPMIIILLAALAVQVLLCLLGEAGWFEPAGIFLAILAADGVAAFSEKSQENKAAALKAAGEAKETAKVVREGCLTELPVGEVVAGDIVFLQAGDKLPADGEIIAGELKVDQSVLNGETEEAVKKPVENAASDDAGDLLNGHYVYRGTVVCGGEAYLLVKVVGDKTLFGELALAVQEETRETPLQVKLRKLARQIAVSGYAGAAAIVAGILLRTLVTGALPDDVYAWIRLIMNAVTVAVTIVVCAVPEGLPMLTSILLSLQSLKMAEDNVLVRKINGLETAGSLNILFSDKTGTITEGRLSVAELVTGNGVKFNSLQALNPGLVPEIITGIGINNSACADGGTIVGGNSTDRALLAFLAGSDAARKISKEEVHAFSAFDSNKKFSSASVVRNGKTAVYIKGAPEKIIGRCTRYLDENGREREFTERESLAAYLDAQAARSMRLLAAAVSPDGDPEDELTLICVVSIRDNVRAEAAAAIREVRQAGIQVVMVTGDRKETAAAIAREAGLLTDADIALTSAEMAAVSDEELKELLPRLRVVARALPADKSRLVRVAQELDLVAGMTGDGVNDSPALKKADVGFAMGSGTEAAKAAGDITVLDDNFASIEKAVLYGRTIFKSIRKFLVFQLTVNAAAVLICFLGPMLGENVVLTVIQLLLINLAMDTLAAIAFGSEPALPEYLREAPVPRAAGLISGEMAAQILLGAGYITFICLSILFLPPVRGLFGTADIALLKSALFAVFMLAIVFQGLNARAGGLNLFADLGRNKNFLAVMALILVLQYLFITFGGQFLGVKRLPISAWGICVLLALPIIPLDLLRKLLRRRV